MPGPLEGIPVIELGVWVAGPAAGGILADWGADVVKIEPPTGDPARQFAQMIGGDVPINPPFEIDNRSKRSIVVDLRPTTAAISSLDLIAGADVFLTNIRMDALERLGLDAATLLAAQPAARVRHHHRLRARGPERDRAAYDIGAFWARSGVARLLTAPGVAAAVPTWRHGRPRCRDEPRRAINAGLVARDRPGGRPARGHVAAAPRDVHDLLRPQHAPAARCADRDRLARDDVEPGDELLPAGDDRWVWLIGLEGDRHWPRSSAPSTTRSGSTTSASRPAARRDNVREMIAVFDAVFATPRDEWAERFDREDVWWAPVQTTEEVLADPQAWPAAVFLESPTARASPP